jgi:hypothetical protein
MYLSPLSHSPFLSLSLSLSNSSSATSPESTRSMDYSLSLSPLLSLPHSPLAVLVPLPFSPYILGTNAFCGCYCFARSAGQRTRYIYHRQDYFDPVWLPLYPFPLFLSTFRSPALPSLPSALDRVIFRFFFPLFLFIIIITFKFTK